LCGQNAASAGVPAPSPASVAGYGHGSSIGSTCNVADQRAPRTNASTDPASNWTAIAETSSPDTRVSSSTPLGRNTRTNQIAVPQEEPEDDGHRNQRRGKRDRVRRTVPCPRSSADLA
jgi:hypothetical protein